MKRIFNYWSFETSCYIFSKYIYRHLDICVYESITFSIYTVDRKRVVISLSLKRQTSEFQMNRLHWIGRKWNINCLMWAGGRGGWQRRGRGEWQWGGGVARRQAPEAQRDDHPAPPRATALGGEEEPTHVRLHAVHVLRTIRELLLLGQLDANLTIS